MFCLYVCKCTTCKSGTCKGQKRASDPVELELQTVSSHHVGAGN